MPKEIHKRQMTPADKEAGRVLRTLRLRAGLSQEALADLVELTFQQIQKYEKGGNRMSVGRIDQFAKLLKVSPMEFFPLSAKAGERVEFSMLKNRAAFDMMKAFDAITDGKVRASLLAHARDLVGMTRGED